MLKVYLEFQCGGFLLFFFSVSGLLGVIGWHYEDRDSTQLWFKKKKKKPGLT